MAQEARLLLLFLVVTILGAVGYGVYAARHEPAQTGTAPTTQSGDADYGAAVDHTPAPRPADYDNGIDPKGGYAGGASGTEVAQDDIPCFDSAESLQRATSAIADQDPGGFAAEMATHGTHIVKGRRFDVVESKPPIEHVRADGKDCYILTGSNRPAGE